MADTVVVVESAPTPPSPETPRHPSAHLALTCWKSCTTTRAIWDTRSHRLTCSISVSNLDAQVAQLAANDVAQIDATTAVVAAVESVAADVEDLEPGDQVEIAPEPEPKDTTPGKTHWLHRSGREWTGK